MTALAQKHKEFSRLACACSNFLFFQGQRNRWIPHRVLLQMGGVCSSSTYKSTAPPVVSTLSELLSKQLISVLVADALDRDDELLDVVFTPTNNTSERRRYAYTVLTRLARQDQYEQRWLRKALERHLQHTGDDALAVAMETGSPMPEMMAEVLQNPRMPARQKLVNTLRVQIPKETTNLLKFAVTIAEQHVALLVEKGPRKNFNTRLNAKDAYALLASRYEATGHFTEALDARQKALEFAQALVKSNPSA